MEQVWVVNVQYWAIVVVFYIIDLYIGGRVFGSRLYQEVDCCCVFVDFFIDVFYEVVFGIDEIFVGRVVVEQRSSQDFVFCWVVVLGDGFWIEVGFDVLQFQIEFFFKVCGIGFVLVVEGSGFNLFVIQFVEVVFYIRLYVLQYVVYRFVVSEDIFVYL